MPIRLGQEFDAYAGSLRRGLKRVVEAADYLRDLGIGGSAVGTGVNVEPEYPSLMITHLRASAKVELREGSDRIQLMQSMGDVAGFCAQLRVLALDLSRSRAICVFSRAGRAPAWTRSVCLPYSPARRSCPAR